MLTLDEVKKVAELSRIELTEAELEKYRKELSSVLDYVAELSKVNTDGLEEVSQVTGLENIQREDVAKISENRDDILSQAPEIKDGFYKVKAIL